MSGGSMDYLSVKVEEAHFHETTIERKAFRDHLKKVAKALHAIEWNDSGDGADDIDIFEACEPRNDGWIESKRPDKPAQKYLMFPGS